MDIFILMLHRMNRYLFLYITYKVLGLTRKPLTHLLEIIGMIESKYSLWEKKIKGKILIKKPHTMKLTKFKLTHAHIHI